MSELARGDLDELVRRVLALSKRNGTELASPVVTEAVLGTVPEALPTLREAFDEYLLETASRHTTKSEAQRKKWRALRDRSVERFLEVMKRKDMPLDEIERSPRTGSASSGRTGSCNAIRSSQATISFASMLSDSWT